MLIDWTRADEPRQRTVVGSAGAALGPAGGPLRLALFVSPRRAEEVRDFASSFAPFRATTGGSELVFAGTGRAAASSAERRMIAEWCRQLAAEAAVGRENPAYGLVLSWHRGGGSGACDDLSVYRTGEAHASSCAWEGELAGRLAAGELRRLYAWFDGLGAFQAGGDEAPSGALPARLVFAGRGPAEASAADRAAIADFAAALDRELAARRTGPPAAPRLLRPETAPAAAVPIVTSPPSSAVPPPPESVPSASPPPTDLPR
ncbi:MAG TPA: hypothetical protein VOA87_23305 [Thermoanaerobaculia bacterium]|nr:hypothetical protein [Thermoanaerobaculia bacterium]